MKPQISVLLSALLALAAIVFHAQVTRGQQPNRKTTPSPTTTTATDPDKVFAFDWIDAHSDAMNTLSLEIWNAAELSFREFKSSRALIRFLESNGFSVEQRIADMPTAFVASYGSGKPVIALFGEYDALAGMSQKAQPIRESLLAGTPGHACGHNLIGASTAVAAASIAKVMEQRKIKGTLRFYGTPAEETGSGKNYMLSAGAFKDVDILLGWHPYDRTQVTFEYSKAVAEMHFKFTGVAAHASIAPYLGRSALHAVELMDTGVNFMREQLKEDARIHYVITKGGGSPNVIPPEAESWYFIRANKNKDVLDIFAWVSEIAKGAAMMTRTQVEINVDSDNHERLPNRPLAETVDRNLQLVGAPKFNDDENTEARKMQEGMKEDFKFPLEPAIEPLPDSPTQGAYSTDVGNLSWNIPTQSFEVASYPYGLPIHSWQVAASAGMAIGRTAMPVAAKTLAATAIDLFRDPVLIETAKKDFQNRRTGYEYRLLTPANRKPPVYGEDGSLRPQ